MIYDYRDYNLYCFGDIHGNFKTLFHEIKKYLQEPPFAKKKEKNDKREKKLFIVCGDCGLGFNKPSYYQDLFNQFNKELESCDSVLLLVRGNHDDKSYFDGDKVNLSRIKAIPDYSVVITSNLTTLCVGGAVSFDRTWRKQQEAIINKHKPKTSQKKIYWEDEAIVYDEEKLNEIIHNGLKIDSVITHALPSEFNFELNYQCKQWFTVDPNLKADFDEEKSNITKILNFLLSHDCDIMIWLNGHIHQHILKVVELKEGVKSYWISLNETFRTFNATRGKNEIQSLRENKDTEQDKKAFSAFNFIDFDLNSFDIRKDEVMVGDFEGALDSEADDRIDDIMN